VAGKSSRVDGDGVGVDRAGRKGSNFLNPATASRGGDAAGARESRREGGRKDGEAERQAASDTSWRPELCTSGKLCTAIGWDSWKEGRAFRSFCVERAREFFLFLFGMVGAVDDVPLVLLTRCLFVSA